MSSLRDLPTPFVAVDRARVRANIFAMQARANAAGVRLRPHAKTHKSLTIARWQLDAGAAGICCAKLSEAEMFADAGVADIRLPYPVNPSNSARVLALQGRTRLSIIVDDLDVAREWSAVMVGVARRLEVLVKVDVGFHRCGVDPDAPDVVARVADIARLPGLQFQGLLSHAGHAYAAASSAELAHIALSEIETLTTIADGLRGLGLDVPEISVGSTPSSRFVSQQPGVTEMRPGNYVFFDRTQVGLEAASLGECAMTVIATVVSRPSPTRVILDAGSKTLTNDGARGFGATPGHGSVYPSLDAGNPDPAIVIERLSEEHATTRVAGDCPLRPGDRVRILPNHSCVVTNLADSLVVVEDGVVVDRLRVDGRGRNW